MPIVTIPFLFLGLAAKIANRRLIKRSNPQVVHSNKESQLYSLVEIITSNINDEVLGSLYKNGFVKDQQKTTIAIKN